MMNQVQACNSVVSCGSDSRSEENHTLRVEVAKGINESDSSLPMHYATLVSRSNRTLIDSSVRISQDGPVVKGLRQIPEP